MLAAETACIEEGIRSIDVRHEQAAAMMAHAYGRVLNTLGVCMAASGPGHHEPRDRRGQRLGRLPRRCWRSAAPARSRSSARRVPGDGPGGRLQADHQVGRARASTPDAHPRVVAMAVRQALTGRPGPVYLDMPGDVLYQRGRRGQRRAIPMPRTCWRAHRPLGDPAPIDDAIAPAAEGRAPDHHHGQRHPVVGRLRRAAEASSSWRASRSTPRRRAAASCPTITSCRSWPPARPRSARPTCASSSARA